MILNGKAEEHFFKWLSHQGTGGINIINFEYAHFISLSIQNALIIEWFDSVGIGIDAYTTLYKGKLAFCADIIAEFDIERDSATINLNLNCEKRNEALKVAIKKACEIYNSKL